MPFLGLPRLNFVQSRNSVVVSHKWLTTTTGSRNDDKGFQAA